MIITPTRNDSDDFIRRYGETFGFLHQPDQPRTLVYITSIDGDKLYFTVGKNPTKHWVYLDSNVKFEFLPVDRGWYMDKNDVPLYMQRLPERQWKRGISNSNTTLYRFSQSKFLAIAPLDVRYELLDSVFSQSNLAEHYKYIEDKDCAISKQFAVKGTEKRGRGLYIYTAQLGEINDGRITLFTDVFRQEMVDVIRKKNLPLTMET